MNRKHGLLALPAELIEEITTYLYHDPPSIAALSKTSRFLYSVIYESTDQHLWRRVFLMLFDDPRPTRALLSAADAKGVLSEKFIGHSWSYEWQQEFQRRFAAQTFMFRSRKHEIEMSALIEENPARLYDTVKVLLSLYIDSSPYFFHPLLYDILGETGAPAMAGSPPLAVILATSLANPNEPGLNSTWLSRILSSTGFPPTVIGKFIADPFKAESEGLSEMYRESWDHSENGMAFFKLMFYAGLHPSPKPEISGYSLRSKTHDEQEIKALAISKYRVYNMRYLTARRHWGPFRLYADANFPAPTDIALPPPTETRATAHIHHQHLSALLIDEDLSEDEEDEDYELNSDASSSAEIINEQTSLALLEDFPLDGQDGHPGSSGMPPLFPDKPHLVLPDYRFLAYARVIAEDKLVELFRKITDRVPTFPGLHDINDFQRALAVSLGVDPAEAGRMERTLLDDLGRKLPNSLRSLDLSRMGSAPGFWKSGWGKNSFLSDLQEPDEVQEKSKEFDEVEGWDWAGIGGHWVQSVSWLDYHDLIDFNADCLEEDLEELPGTEHLDETHHTVYVTLRVDHYEKPPLPDLSAEESADPKTALVYRLPVIHVVGESHFNSELDVMSRKMVGTVRAIGDGAIRLSLVWLRRTSADLGEDAMEWSSETVQMGNIGAAYGFVGLWTGAEHSRDDPLGHILMWKYK